VSTSICPSRQSGGSLRRLADCLSLGISSGLCRLFRDGRCDCGRAARVDVCNQVREQGRLQSTCSSSTSGQHMSDADGKHPSDFTCNDGPLDIVAELTQTDEIAPVVAPPARPASPRSAAEFSTRPGRDEQTATEGDGELAGHAARRLEG